MEPVEILVQEYNNLWNEKLIHKQGIRKFHNYLTYITTLGSLALAFHGVSLQDFFNASDPGKATYLIKNASNIVHLFFIPFAPIVLITITFPLNDIFHTYAIGNQIAQIEKKINQLSEKQLLVWEHVVCPFVYGGEKNSEGVKITNLISKGDYLLLVPALMALGVVTTIISASYIQEKVGCWASMGYIAIILYMVIAIIWLGRKLQSYTKPDGNLTKAIISSNG